MTGYQLRQKVRHGAIYILTYEVDIRFLKYLEFSEKFAFPRIGVFQQNRS